MGGNGGVGDREYNVGYHKGKNEVDEAHNCSSENVDDGGNEVHKTEDNCEEGGNIIRFIKDMWENMRIMRVGIILWRLIVMMRFKGDGESGDMRVEN